MIDPWTNEPNNLPCVPRCTICGLTLSYVGMQASIVPPMPTMYVYTSTCEHDEEVIFDLDGNKVIQRTRTKS